MNDPFVLRQAGRFAQRLMEASPDDVKTQITAAYWLAFGRSPSNNEVNRAMQFIHDVGLTEFCRVLFNTNEFLYVD